MGEWTTGAMDALIEETVGVCMNVMKEGRINGWLEGWSGRG